MKHIAGTQIEVDRRAMMKWSLAGVLGLSLADWFALLKGQAAEEINRARARNVLVILEQGGLSHIDTFDPKPEVVAEHRSPFSPIATSVPGLRFTSLLPRTARLAHKLAVLRSMRHPRGGADDHPNGTHYALSGSHPINPLQMPDIGSVAAQVLASRCRYLPPYIMVPGNNEQNAVASSGFLPIATRPFKTGGYDISLPGWRVGDLTARDENQGGRFARRRDLLRHVDGRALSPGMNRFYEQAFDTLSNPLVNQVFDLHAEPDRVRALYGPGHRGACYLLGRKLIEAGVRFVTVDVRWPMSAATPRGGNLNWDHHDHIYADTTCELPGATGAGAGRYGIGHWVMMGSTDRAFAALIEDLDERGLLEETLVCFVSEFGRTPRINRAQGRDHWPHAYSIVLAGAGVPGGQVIGSSDRDGGYVANEPHTFEDYAATIYAKLGIDRSRPLYTSSNRPVYLHEGEPIAALF